ncbi:MAG: hypothetical protein WCP28_02270 [Actinomycetes bacterium]
MSSQRSINTMAWAVASTIATPIMVDFFSRWADPQDSHEQGAK